MTIAIILSDNFSMWQFFRALIESLVQRGHTVHVITPSGDYTPQIESLGVTHIAVPMGRFISPLADAMLAWRLYRLFRRERYDIVHNILIKQSILGAFVARLSGVPRVVSLLLGVGYPFFVPEPGIRERAVGWLLGRLLPIACRLTDKVCFMNPDDYAMFLDQAFIPEAKGVVIRGMGVNIEQYSHAAVDASRVEALRRELAVPPGRRIVTMVVARQIWSKGVLEFLDAAETIAKRRSDALFVLAGPLADGHPDAVPADYLTGRQHPDIRILLGFRTDIREFLALSDIVVLPSYFREGLPQVLQEALALGKPIVTTDNTGCREVVDHGRNGFLVSTRDARALASAINALLDDKQLCDEFCLASRRKAIAEFDERVVANRILTLLYGL